MIGLVWCQSFPRRSDFLKIGSYLASASKTHYPDFMVLEN
jgi:hypothetical protein